MTVDRRYYHAKLTKKILLSGAAQCYHLEFSVPEVEILDFQPGQFLSLLGEDERGKQQTRAYTIASAPRAGGFDLCLNRVEGGYFSNELCDLEPGQEVEFHGPHGLFVLKQPFTDSIFVATGTGIAPFRSFLEWLYPESGEDRSEGREIWLVFGARSRTELYYGEYFEKIAAEHENFHYLPTLSRADEGWTGLRGHVQEHVARIVKERAERGGAAADKPEGAAFDIHAYICGLNEMVASTRAMLKEMGWERKQIVYERYD